MFFAANSIFARAFSSSPCIVRVVVSNCSASMPYVWRISAKTGLAVQSGSANRLSGRASASGVKEGWIVASDVQKARSEEHTSELQSLMRNSYAGFCLKKKKKNRQSI